MHVLGIRCHYHDAAFPLRAIEFCLGQAGIEATDLDYVVFYEKPFAKAERLMTTIVATFPRSLRLFREGFHVWLKEKVWIKAQIQKHLGTPADRVLFVDHHLSHAASAFFASPFEEAAVLTVDGVGEWTTATCGRAAGDWGQGGPNRLDLTHELRFPHSLGLLYSVFTAFLGFEVNEGEYKVMGMAPYGTPKYADDVRKLLRLHDDGGFSLDMDYFSYHHSPDTAFNGEFERLFGAPRDPKSHFFTESSGY